MKIRESIAVALAIIVVVGTLFMSSGLFTSLPQGLSLKSLSLSLTFPNVETPNITRLEVADEAWQVFESYREFARDLDLTGLKSVTHQISPTCSDPALLTECQTLMTGVAQFTESWKQSDFKNVAYDDKQIILSTDYMVVEGSESLTQRALIFTRDAAGTPKLLAIKFCEGNEEIANLLELSCILTDPATRDADNNGWWSEVEFYFYR